jgi:DNA primase small subunit
VIDIDISDYDNVRLCGCKEAKVCNSCWQLMECAMKVLDHLLNDVFGCKHRLWVFSGRRGIHCWVADEQFRILDNQARASVADFLHIYIGSDKQSKKVNLTKIPHPSFGQNSIVFR